MKFSHILVGFCLAGLATSGIAAAATTCVLNKNTGQFESKNPQTGDCNAKYGARSIEEIQKVIFSDGTKVTGAGVMTNAAAMPAIPAAADKPEAKVAAMEKPVTAPAPAPMIAQAPNPSGAVAAPGRTFDAPPPHPATAVTAAPQAVAQTPPASKGDVSTLAAPLKPAAPVGPEKRYWSVRLEDGSVYGTLARWAADAKPKRQVVWQLPREFELEAGDTEPFFGTFEQAVDRVLDSFENSDYPPKGCFYENGVLRVVRRTNDSMECKR